MTQAEKAQLRYIALLTQNSQVQGDMARSINTPANALRILQQQFVLLARAVGNIVIPILMKILPVAIAVTKAIRLIANAIASLFGFELTEIDYSGIQGLSGAVDDVGDSVASTGKQISKQLGKFDELNNLTTSSGGGGGGAGGIGGAGFDLDLPSYDALDGLSKQMDDLTDKVLKFFGITEDGFGKLSWSFSDMDTKAKLLVITIGLLVGAKALGKLATIITAIKGTSSALGLGTIIKGLGTILANVTGLSTVFNGVIAPLGAVVSGTMSLGTYATIAGEALLTFASTIFGVIAPLATLVWGCVQVEKEMTDFNDSILKFNSTGPMFDKTISNTTKKAVEPFIDALNDLGTTIWGLNLKDIVTDDDVNNVKSQTATIAQALKDNLVDKTSEMEKTLQNTKLFPDVSKREAYLETMRTSLQSEQEMVDFYQSQINSIVETASNEKRAITNAERVQIEEYQRQMGEMGINILSDSEKEAIKIKNQFNTKFFELSHQQVVDAVAQAKELKDKTIEQANEEYEEKLALAEEMKQTLPGFTEEMYDEMVTDAESARDEQIKKANETYSGIVNEVEKNYPEVAKTIDLENGKVLTAYEGFKKKVGDFFGDLWEDIKSIWNDKVVPWWQKNVAPWFTKKKWKDLLSNAVKGIKETFENLSIKIKTPHFSWTTTPATGWVKKVLDALSIPASLPKLNVSWYAEGGFPDVGEMFIAREAGPELVGRIGNKTAVANNDQIVQGISAGVYNAMVSAGASGDTNVSVNIGNRTLSKVFTSGIKSENNRYGRAVVEV